MKGSSTLSTCDPLNKMWVKKTPWIAFWVSLIGHRKHVQCKKWIAVVVHSRFFWGPRGRSSKSRLGYSNKCEEPSWGKGKGQWCVVILKITKSIVNS